jgi:large subunit ribosomal protein L11
MAQSVDAMVEGGKATAAPPLGPALGPLGVNIGQVISEINKKTADFKGMQVPVKITVDADKSFKITVGTPPASAIIKKEAGLEKGSGNPLADKVADIRIEQVIKVAKMKVDDLSGIDMFQRCKEVCGTCNSMGVMVEGMSGKDCIKAINEGKWKDKISAGRTELSAEDLKKLEAERKKLLEEMERRKAEFMAVAKQTIESMQGKPRSQIKAKLIELKVPTAIIEELLPVEAKAPEGGAPAAAAPAGAKK